jgi:hypothetical protein
MTGTPALVEVVVSPQDLAPQLARLVKPARSAPQIRPRALTGGTPDSVANFRLYA